MSGADTRAVTWDDLVRFHIPADWAIDTEEHEGKPVLALRPPGGQGVLRVVADTIAAKDSPAYTLREVALRFVRPDDGRASDRVLEDRRGGGIIATAVMVTEEDGRHETHYLWLAGIEAAASVRVAMFSFAAPAEWDGALSDVLGPLDEAIRSAEIL